MENLFQASEEESWQSHSPSHPATPATGEGVAWAAVKGRGMFGIAVPGLQGEHSIEVSVSQAGPFDSPFKDTLSSTSQAAPRALREQLQMLLEPNSITSSHWRSTGSFHLGLCV